MENPNRRHIFVALPTYDGRIHGGLLSTLPTSVQGLTDTTLSIMTFSTSALCFGFNRLWCEALNHPEITHFLMVHSDIFPMQQDFTRILVEEMEKHNADVMSVVMAIKTTDGNTSTCLHRKQNNWDFNPRRLTLQEMAKLPETFGEKELRQLYGLDGTLGINTGLMLVKLGGWSKKHFFSMEDRIVERNGKYIAEFQPEDWRFSLKCKKWGLKVMATYKVRAVHVGQWYFSNEPGWGTKEHDGG